MPRRRDPRPPAALELKSIRLTGITVILHSADFDTLKTHIDTLFSASDDFFGGEVAVFDCARLAADSAAPDWAWLVGELRRRGLYAYAVKNATAAIAKAARAAGLAVVRDDDAHATSALTDAAVAQASDAFVAADVATAENVAAASPTAAVAAIQPELDLVSAPEIAAESASAKPSAPTVILDKPLRSGQRVYAQGGDLIVLAVVNPGAEVIADGSIHVYAPLKGRALAGASGDTSARIFTSRFEAELVSIAGVYRTFDAAPDLAVHQRPAQVRLLTDSNQLDVVPL